MNNLLALKVLLIWIILWKTGRANEGTLRFLTFNTALTPRTDQYDVRREKIWDAVKELDADVICLQEVWFHQDLQSAVEKTRSTHAYSFSAMHDEVGVLRESPRYYVPCPTDLLVTFIPCILTRCSRAADSIAYVTCAKEKCRMLEVLEQECITCLVMSRHLSRCFLDVGYATNIHGLLMLSKLPLHNVTLTRFVPDRKLILPRAFISAEVDRIGMVTCTHTTADLGQIYFEDLPFRRWNEQTLTEARVLVQHQRAATSGVIMGDLNSSLQSPLSGIQADMPGACNYIMNNGYTDIYMDNVGICTWCLYNSLTSDNKSLVYDHILLKKVNATGAMRVLDNDIQGRSFPVSDHYGVLVVVCPINNDNATSDQ